MEGSTQDKVIPAGTKQCYLHTILQRTAKLKELALIETRFTPKPRTVMLPLLVLYFTALYTVLNTIEWSETSVIITITPFCYSTASSCIYTTTQTFTLAQTFTLVWVTNISCSMGVCHAFIRMEFKDRPNVEGVDAINPK
jgi:hypothetical protein